MELKNHSEVAQITPGLGIRIAKIADLVGGKKNLAKAIGISESQLYRYISGDSQPTVEPLAAIARCGSVHLDWLVLGVGPTGIIQEINELNAPYTSEQQFIEIAEYVDDNIEAENLSVADLGKFSFNKEWLLKTGVALKDLRIIRAHGNSMSPTIDDGDLLIIDINQRRFNGDAIYLLRIDCKYLVPKRLQHTTDRGLLVVNDNVAYRDQQISEAQKESLEIAGKIIWAAGLV